MIDNKRKASCLRCHWFAFQSQKGDRNIIDTILTENTRYSVKTTNLVLQQNIARVYCAHSNVT